MTGIPDGALGELPPALTLACTACQLVYEPDPAAFGTGTTGCPRCGGWTWIAQLGTAEWSTATGTDQVSPAQQHAGTHAAPGPVVTPPRTPTGPGSPTTSR